MQVPQTLLTHSVHCPPRIWGMIGIIRRHLITHPLSVRGSDAVRLRWTTDKAVVCTAATLSAVLRRREVNNLALIDTGHLRMVKKSTLHAGGVCKCEEFDSRAS